MTSRVIQKTLFGKGSRSPLANSHVVLERDLLNKHLPKASSTQLANFNKKEEFRKLIADPPPSAIVAAPSVNVKRKPSKWFMYCKRLEEKALKEDTGLDGRLMRP